MLSCGPLLIPSSVLKRRVRLRKQELCHRSAHLLSTANWVPRSEELATPKHKRLCSQPAQFSATANFSPPLYSIEEAPNVRVM